MSLSYRLHQNYRGDPWTRERPGERSSMRDATSWSLGLRVQTYEQTA